MIYILKQKTASHNNKFLLLFLFIRFVYKNKKLVQFVYRGVNQDKTVIKFFCALQIEVLNIYLTQFHVVKFNLKVESIDRLSLKLLLIIKQHPISVNPNAI